MLHEAIEQTERVDFEAMFNKKNLYVLKVSGDSMIDAQIADGDYVVIRKQSKAFPGQIVVAETDEGEATLKALVSRAKQEPHPPRAGQLLHAADLRQRLPRLRRRRRRRAKSRLTN